MSEILSISLPKELVEKLEQIRKDKGYTSRSEVVRDALKLLLSKSEVKEGLVLSTSLILAKSASRKTDQEISNILHEYSEIIIQFNHTHFGDYCVESITCVGDVKEVNNLLSRLRRLKGIIEVRDVKVPLERKNEGEKERITDTLKSPPYNEPC